MIFLCYTVVEISLTKNIERKKKERIQGRTNRRRLILNPSIQLAIVNLYIKYEISILNGFGDIFDERWRERKVNIYSEEQTGEGWLPIPRFNLSLSSCIKSMNFLCYLVVEISLTKNMERKKNEQILGRTNRRRLILNPTIQLVIVNLYTKYEVSILNGF